MSFHKEFSAKWNSFLQNKNSADLYGCLDLMVENFEDYISIEPHEILKLLDEGDKCQEPIDFEWPGQIFYFLNEQLVDLNRLFNVTESKEKQLDVLKNFLKILQACLVTSKNDKNCELIINSCILSQLLNASNHILLRFEANETETQIYCKIMCFLLIRVHDPNLNWIKRFSSDSFTSSENQHQKYHYKFESTFFLLLFNGTEISDKLGNIDLSALLSHTYACILFTAQTDNLLRAITPPVVDHLFSILTDESDLTHQSQQSLCERPFTDKKLIVCKCLPMLANALHLSMPDKRQVELTSVLDKCLVALECDQRKLIKLELVRVHLDMLNNCGDKAALKIVLASKRFFVVLLQQCGKQTATESEESVVHEFLMLSLKLIRSLLDGSDTVKDTFVESNCYNLLYDVLKNGPIDKQMAMLITNMINETSLDQSAWNSRDELQNCEMAALLIKLLPFMQQSAQETSLASICRLCTANSRNQLRACKSLLLENLIMLLEHHSAFSFPLIEQLFRTIEILGRCSLRASEVSRLLCLLQPAKTFPYGLHILRCFSLWSRVTSAAGTSLTFLSSMLHGSEENDTDLGKARTKSTNSLRTTGTGALSANAQQQAKHFFDFQHSNSGIRVPIIKKWPGYAFTFHCWLKLRSDLETFDKKRRQLYSFYNDYGQGFEAFFTPDCSSLVVSVCTKKEFLSVQLRELDFDASQSINTSIESASDLNGSAETHGLTTSTSDYWHSICVVHVPAKSPFGYSSVCIYIDGVLKKETDLKIPNFGDALSHVRIASATARPTGQSTFSNVSNTLTAPLTSLKSVFNLSYKGNVTEKSLNVTSIPAGSQDTVWDPSTCLMGQMSSCFVLHDTISDQQARLIYELGPNQFAFNWLDLHELTDLKSKLLLHYDAKCSQQFACIDLSGNRFTGKFSGLQMSCENFRDSLNAIGSVQALYVPLFHYLATNSDYYELVNSEWVANVKTGFTENASQVANIRSLPYEKALGEGNIAALLLSMLTNLCHNNDLLQDRVSRDNGVPLLSFLLQRLPRRFIDAQLLHTIQDFVTEAATFLDKQLLALIYEHLVFEFRLWNRADLEVRIAHLTYISTIIKDDKKYFRNSYGVQFFLDMMRNYLTPANGSMMHEIQLGDDELRNLRSSCFGLIKYYVVKDLRIGELQAIVSFISQPQVCLQSEALDLLIGLLDTKPNQTVSDQLVLLLFEPSVADGLYGLLAQSDLNAMVQRKLLKVMRLLLSTKKVYDKSKSRMRLIECGGYVGLVSKIQSQRSQVNNSQLALDLLENFLLDEMTSTTHDDAWHIVSLLTISSSPRLSEDFHTLISSRLKCSQRLINFIFANANGAKLLVKCQAWQDIICQLFCLTEMSNYEKQPLKNQPKIVVSRENSNKISREQRSDAAISPISNDQTPPQNQLHSTLMKKYQNHQSYPDSTDTNVNRALIMREESLNDESLILSPVKEMHLNESIKTLDESDEMAGREELFEKLVYLVFKLAWEGVTGSGQEAWKERCQIFSSLRRLGKEYMLIKSPEIIEMRLLELYLQYIGSDLKHATNLRDTTQSGENAREIIKLVEHFIASKHEVSEQLITSTIALLDQMHTFDAPALNVSTTAEVNLSTFGIINDEWQETAFLGMNILVNCMSNEKLDICAQAAARVNAIIHSRPTNSNEEACYLICRIHEAMCEYPDHYAFLLPVLKSLVDKHHQQLQMHVQVPNIPFSKVSDTFDADFKEYSVSDEWRVFVAKQAGPMREQYLAMTLTPCQMNNEIWWNGCAETLMVAVHKRNRALGEAKIKFEDAIYNGWKKREREETTRIHNQLISLKRGNLAMRKQLHNSLRFFAGERGAWNEGSKEHFWMLSAHENREGMRCKLVENLQFDTHLEASRMRDCSSYSPYLEPVKQQEVVADDQETAANLAQKLKLNKQAINNQLNEDLVSDEEFLTDKEQSNSKSEQSDSLTKSSDTISLKSHSTTTSTVTYTNPASATKPQTPQEHVELPELEEKEKLLLKSECELITTTRVIKGRFELTNRYIYFFDTFSAFYCDSMEQSGNESSQFNSTRMACQSFVGNLSQATHGYSCHDFQILSDFKLPLTELQEVQLRRYNLRRSALEFFHIDKTSYFINFNKSIRNKIYSRIVSMKSPNLQSYVSVRTPADLLKATDYTQKWINHEMSNFEYLMMLNRIAGRSFNDLSQYPIFPWILSDYTSSQLDLDDPRVYRDLSKPVGVLNPKNEDYVRQKYDLFEDPTGTMRKFHYGTHYSNSANVMHYLIRLEPFTTLHIQLQSDRFDVADRQFHNIANTWRVIYENPNDVKELIPEFFYLPEFMENTNNFDFGELQASKNRVNDVSMPAWAKNPEHFIYLHRKALESDYVSEHLHEWIDLIFGYKQQGVEAEKSLNVFMYCSYEGAIDLDAITNQAERSATEGMISNFGQTPTQLLKTAHPRRKSRVQSIKDKIIQGKPIILWQQINNLKAYYVELTNPKSSSEPLDPVVFISIPRNHVKSFMQQGLSDPLLSISQSGVIGVNGWQAYERSLTNLFSFEKDPSLLSEKTKKSIAGPFDPTWDITASLFVLTHDSKLLISGGHWDNSLRVFSLSKYRTVNQIFQHSDTVTCLAQDYTGTMLVSGSRDTTVMVWQVIKDYGYSVGLVSTPLHILYGHTGCVTSVDVSLELDMVVSASLDGTVNVHTVRKGHFVRSLSLSSDSDFKFDNLMLRLSNQRHILIYTSSVKEKHLYNLFLYSINGKLISTEKLNHPLQEMIIKDDYCILAALVRTAAGKTSNGNTQFIPASKIIFKENYDLRTIQTMRLKAPISCMFMTREDSHLLVSLSDGKLIVITGERMHNK